MFPIDSIKVRSRPPSSGSRALKLASPYQLLLTTTPLPFLSQTRMQVIPITPTSAYNTLYSSLTRVATTDGLRTLWKGVNSVIMGAGPAHAVYFGTYEIVKDLAGGNRPGHQFAATGECFWTAGWRLRELAGDAESCCGTAACRPELIMCFRLFSSALGGAAATIASDALMNPFDVIKQRMQLRNSQYASVSSAFKTVYRTEGLGAFYVSYPTTLMMTIPFTAVQFTAYEYLKDVINPNGTYSPTTHIIAGGAAGAVAAAVSTPLDVMKTLYVAISSSDRVLNL